MSLQRGWHTIEISGKAVDVFEPSQPRDPARVVMFLHGHGCQTLIHNRAYSFEFERHGLRAICPHGQRSWWLPVICSEFDAELSPIAFIRSRLMPWIESTWNVRAPAVGLLGVSMGGQGVLQMSYRHPAEFPVVAALSPVIDIFDWMGRGLPLDEMFPDREAARQQTVTLQVQGLNWPRQQWLACDPTDLDVRPGLERLMSKLSSSGVPYQSDLSSMHGGHSWDYFNHMASRAVQFLVDGLNSEERRFV